MANITQREDPESFISGYADWRDPRFAGRRRALDTHLSEQRGMQARSGLARTEQVLTKRATNPSNNPAVRGKAQKDLRTVSMLQEHPGVQDRPTRVSDIAANYANILSTAVGKGVEAHADPNRPVGNRGEIPGTGWYFEHRRGQAESLGALGSKFTSRQVAAMGAKLSASKTPEDERAAMSGIAQLTEMGGSRIGGRPLRNIPSEEIGRHAAAAAAWGNYESPTGTAIHGQPTMPRPQASKRTFEALRLAGRGHAANVGTAMSIARGEITPKQAYGETTPKTSAYGEMQAQSDPGSLVEADYRNIAAHYRDVTAGTQSRNQGMFMFSQDEPGPRAHALGSDTPTAIDTWMIAAGSGQPMSATHPTTGRSYSPAKRLADKDFPLSSTAGTRTSLGLLGTHTSLDPNAAVSAQHNEAIRRLSEHGIGHVSHDQFGQGINLPASLVQETVWTEARRQAGWDPEYNKGVREQARATRTEETNRARRAKQQQQGTLF